MDNKDMVTLSVTTKIAESYKDAPAYQEDTKMVKIDTIIIVKNGMESGRPSVDLQLVDADGNKYLIFTTGLLIESIAKIISAKSP